MTNSDAVNSQASAAVIDDSIIIDLSVQEDSFDFSSSIATALDKANLELQNLNETIDSINKLTPDCDKLDYALAVSSGALCGILDLFLIGKPGESPIGNVTDKWFANRTMDFAKLCGWKGRDEKSAIRFLERKFQVPYDQRGAGDSGSEVFDLNLQNHHFKSLAHNPTLCGLFFSILDQFSLKEHTSHFVTNGKLISLVDTSAHFELRGHDIPSKLFCAFVNWFGHLISDATGSSGGKGRGSGIPSPFWAWINDLIVLKSKLDVTFSKFDKSVYELALKIYTKGFDVRFQAAQAVPVFVNEMVVRLMYSVRRLSKYYRETERTERSPSLMWQHCEPFSNVTVKRMLTVAHGAFCALDIGDAVIHGFVAGAGTFDPAEFLLRLNIIGIGRFTISLYGEGKCAFAYLNAKKEALFAAKEKLIVEEYIEGLKILASKYDDERLLTSISDLEHDGSHLGAFEKSIELAELRNVPDEKILRSKDDIDAYFKRG